MRKNCRVFTSLSSVVLFTLIIWLVAIPADRVIAEPRGEIRIVESWRPDINVLGHNVLQYLFEYALDRNELVPCLAISRRWVDDTTLELKLREGVRFHNGEPFDAYAVKFNLDYQREHNPGRGVQVYMKNVREIRVIDPYTVHMVLNQPDALMLDKLIVGPISGWAIGAPRYMEKVGWEEFLRRPIGTGPYIVVDEVKDHREGPDGELYAKLVANPRYWSEEYPKIAKISFVRFSLKEAVHALTAGQIDLVTSLIPTDTLKVEESSHSKVVKGRDDVTYTSIWMNLMVFDALPLRDLRVRKALNYAVNKEELKRYAFKGNALEMTGTLTEKAGVDLSGTKSYEWNIPKARELLQDAGYGEGFKMTLFYHHRDYLIARLLKRFYALLKIEVEITPVDLEWMARHNVYPNTRDGYPWEDEDWWVCVNSDVSYAPEIMHVGLMVSYHSGAPWRSCPVWLLEPLDRMYREVLKTRNRDKRFQIYKKANEYIADQALHVFTVAPLSLYGVNEHVQFVPQVSQYLYLDYSFVTDNHWSVRGKNN
jgi:peptide/nickel transport system substrate-binding protein